MSDSVDPSETPSEVGAPGSDTASADLALLAEARAARDQAYVPYSGFAIGAAVRVTDGSVVRGALVENVSLGLTMCAERVALFAAATAGARPTAVALVAARTSGELTFPCGACLQVALELGGPSVRVHVADIAGETASATVGELLPRGPHKPSR